MIEMAEGTKIIIGKKCAPRDGYTRAIGKRAKIISSRRMDHVGYYYRVETVEGKFYTVDEEDCIPAGSSNEEYVFLLKED